MALKFPKSENRNFTRNLVKRHKLVTHLDKYLGTEVENFEFTYEPKQHDDAWHPSGHCTPSPTELYAIATEPQEKKDWGTAMLKTFMVGHFWHQLLQKAVVDLGFADPIAIERIGVNHWEPLITDEETGWPIAKPYHWVTGAADVAPCSIPGHGDYVVDFKTMSGHQFKQSSIPEWAAFKYECQINIYMDFFDIDKGLIVAIEKDSPHEFKEFEFEKNESLVAAIYDKWKFVSECIDNDDPPTDFDDDNFELEQFALGPIAQ